MAVHLLLSLADWNRRISIVPSRFHVSSISYSREECWCSGLGLPGDNETGVLAYPLPGDVIDEIGHSRLAFFDSVRPKWSDWRTTPIPKENWGASGRAPWDLARAASPLETYLNTWGFVIDIDPTVHAAIDGAILTPGSYYGYRAGGGMLLVVPKTKTLYFIYAG
jgi:hypothetical protein